MFIFIIDDRQFESGKALISGNEILNKAHKLPVEQFDLLQELQNGEVKHINMYDTVDLSIPGQKIFRTLLKTYKIEVDNVLYNIEKPEMSGLEILLLAKKLPVENFLLKQQVSKDETREINKHEMVSFRHHGVEKFISIQAIKIPYKIKLDGIIFEISASNISAKEIMELGKKVPITDFELFQEDVNGQLRLLEENSIIDLTTPNTEQFITKPKLYKIKINKLFYELYKSKITGLEILNLTKQAPPERFHISQKFIGGVVKSIDLNQIIDLSISGIEKFTTIRIDQNEG